MLKFFFLKKIMILLNAIHKQWSMSVRKKMEFSELDIFDI